MRSICLAYLGVNTTIAAPIWHRRSCCRRFIFLHVDPVLSARCSSRALQDSTNLYQLAPKEPARRAFLPETSKQSQADEENLPLTI